MRPSLSLRIEVAGRRIGPGKIALLEAIDREGSISGGGRALGMSYRRAWLLVDAINASFAQPAVLTRPGGRHGGASLTGWGRELIALYRSTERRAARAAEAPLARLAAEARPAPSGED